ncbi:MAG TPA: cytochrome c oxidase subunit II [Acidimicrobiia bacterium]|nr:cytochrome c oxidase subunit II [Acidimicrobiia bacterium]
MTRAGLARISFVVTFGLALAACGGASPSTLHAEGSESREVARLWWLMFGLAVAVYVVVASLIVWAIVRGRRRTRRATFNDDKFIWIGGVIAPAIILLVLGVFTMTTSNAIREPSSRALVVKVVGRQWWWDVSYPGRNVRTANEIHVPVHTKIHFELTSTDVIHSFWVPEIAGKEDVIPGQPNHLYVTVEKTGTYRGLCAEYCGLQHAHMGFEIVAESPGDFERWVQTNAQPAQEPVSDLAERGQLVFRRSDCAGCHTIRGTTAAGTSGPDLTHVASRSTIGAETVENTPANLRKWVENPDQLKPGVEMPPSVLSHDDFESVVAYLETRK